MRDVNGSTFTLLAGPADWPQGQGMAWTGEAATLAGRQSWRLPASLGRSAAQARLAATRPVVVDAFAGIARIAQDGGSVESLDGAAWVKLTDQDGTALAPQLGRFIAMALGGARLALLSGDGTSTVLELFDLRGRWPLHSAANPSLPIVPDPAGTALAVAADGPVFVLVQGGLAIFEGGPILSFVQEQTAVFAPVAANPAPLRQTALLANRPGGAPLAMATGPGQVAILLDQGSEAQTLALLDRGTGLWTSTALVATDATPLPYFTDLALLADGRVALMAPNPAPASPADCAVVSPAPGGVTLAPFRYPMLTQYAPRFAAIPGPDAAYLGGAAPDAPAPRPLLALPYPAYLTSGALGSFALPGGDPDQVWHRLYAEAYLPHGTALAVWARAADTAIALADQPGVLALLCAAPPGLARLGPAEATTLAASTPGLAPPSATLAAALALAPFHRQPPLTASPLTSELPFHPGLAAQAAMPGALYEVLLQRSGGRNRQLVGAVLGVVIAATGDGRHSPCLRAVRVYAPRFSYQDQYLPALFHQTADASENDAASTATAADFRERLLASLEGVLTPIETRVAAAEYLLDPYAAPAAFLPWLGSYLGVAVDPGWPEARTRRRLASTGRLYRQRGTYRGVCLAVDIATDGAVQRGEVVLLETHRLRRTDATVLGIPMGGRNVLTADAVPSGNSIVGDTLVLSAERAIDVLALLAPSAVPADDAAAVAQFLDEYADRVQVAAILQGPEAASLRQAVSTVLRAELPAQLAFQIIVAPRRFVLGLSPLLDVDTFLDPPTAAAPLTLGRSVLGRDAVVRDPAALRQ
jgi:phage tail-like protein